MRHARIRYPFYATVKPIILESLKQYLHMLIFFLQYQILQYTVFYLRITDYFFKEHIIPYIQRGLCIYKLIVIRFLYSPLLTVLRNCAFKQCFHQRIDEIRPLQQKEAQEKTPAREKVF